VIAGKSMPEEGPAKCFAFVQTIDTKPKRRLFEVLRGQGMQANQSVVFLTEESGTNWGRSRGQCLPISGDGGEDPGCSANSAR